MVRVSSRYDKGDKAPLYVEAVESSVGDNDDWDETVDAVTHALGTHTDVSDADPDDGDVLTWDEGLGEWVPVPAGALDPDAVKDAGRWEHAVITGSPPDDLYAGGDWLYIWVPGV